MMHVGDGYLKEFILRIRCLVGRKLWMYFLRWSFCWFILVLKAVLLDSQSIFLKVCLVHPVFCIICSIRGGGIFVSGNMLLELSVLSGAIGFEV